MTRRVSLEDESEFAIWRFGSVVEEAPSRRVMIGHRDKAIGESLLLLLSLKGFDAVYAADVIKLDRFLKWWKPHAILLDTRLDSASDYQFTRAVRGEPSNAGILLLAMSNIWPLDPIAGLKQAGFDGHCRRPCSLWRVVDILEGYFAQPIVGPAGPH
ncbi:histidine kinase [Paraburkholderia fungorum]|uniref:histidine kinase n=1 Tax=Paraburkholderia fungorum TaxID=134537 RepID=UPI0038BD2443